MKLRWSKLNSIRALIAVLFLSTLILPTSANAATDCPDTWVGNLPEVSYTSRFIKVGTLDKEVWTVNLNTFQSAAQNNPLLAKISQGVKSGEVVSEWAIESSLNSRFENSILTISNISDLDTYKLAGRGLRNGSFVRSKVSLRARNCSPITLFSSPIVFKGASEIPIGIDAYIALGDPAQKKKYNFEDEETIRIGLSSLKNSLASIQMSQPILYPGLKLNYPLKRSIGIQPLDLNCSTNQKSSSQFSINSNFCTLGIFISISSTNISSEVQWLLVEKVSVWPTNKPSPTPTPSKTPSPTATMTPAPKPSPTIKCKQDKSIYMVLGNKCPKGLTRI